MARNYILAKIEPHCLNSSKVLICCVFGTLAYITNKSNAKRAAQEANTEWVKILESGTVEQLQQLCERYGITYKKAWNKDQLLDRISDETTRQYPALN